MCAHTFYCLFFQNKKYMLRAKGLENTENNNFFSFLLSRPRGMWDLGFQAKDQNRIP